MVAQPFHLDDLSFRLALWGFYDGIYDRSRRRSSPTRRSTASESEPGHPRFLARDGRDRAPARSYLKAIGFGDADRARPIVGIANTWTETMPCNFNGGRELRRPVGTPRLPAGDSRLG